MTARAAARRSVPFGAVLAAALGLAACTTGSGAPSSVPTIDVPTALPTALATTSSSMGSSGGGSSASTACVDAQTMAVLNQLKAPGADVAAILAQNKDTLVGGLASFSPPDAATTAWRDALVTAISSGDSAGVAAQIAVLANGGVTITGC